MPSTTNGGPPDRERPGVGSSGSGRSSRRRPSRRLGLVLVTVALCLVAGLAAGGAGLAGAQSADAASSGNATTPTADAAVPNVTVSAEFADQSVDYGETTNVTLTLDHVPESGLTGVTLLLRLDNSTARFTDDYAANENFALDVFDQAGDGDPARAYISLNNVNAPAVNGGSNSIPNEDYVPAGATNVTLARVEVLATGPGSTELSVDDTSIQNGTSHQIPHGVTSDSVRVDTPTARFALESSEDGSDESPAVSVGETTEAEVVLREVPAGGFNGTTLDLSVDPSVASFTGAYEESDDVRMTTLDTTATPGSHRAVLSVANADPSGGFSVEPGAENVSLGTVTLRGRASGTTDLTADLRSMWTEHGTPVTANVTAREVTVDEDAAASRVRIDVDGSPLEPRGTANASVVLESVPENGFENGTVELRVDRSVANVTDVRDVLGDGSGSVRTDGGTAVAVIDLDGSAASLDSGATNVTLGAIDFRGVESGDARLSAALRRFHDEDGEPVPAFAVADDLEVAYDRPEVTIDARWNRSGGSDGAVRARNATDLEFVLREVPEGGVNGTTIDLALPPLAASFTGEYEASDDFADTYLDDTPGPGTDAVLTVANTNRSVEPGQENVSLGSVEVLGWRNGTATVDASVRTMWTAEGTPVDAEVAQPTLRVTTRGGRPDVDVRFEDRPIEPGETTNATVVLEEVPRHGIRHANWSMRLDGSVANFTGEAFSNDSRFDVRLDRDRTDNDAANVSLYPGFDAPEPGAEDVVLGRFEVRATATGTTAIEFDRSTGSTPVRNFEFDVASTTITIVEPAVYSVDAAPSSYSVVAGEPVEVDVSLSNDGDLAGNKTVRLVAANATRDARTVALEPGESGNLSLSWSNTSGFDGEYEVDVSTEFTTYTLDVSILEPANVSVENVTTEAPVIEGGNVSVGATLTNAGDVDATEEVALRIDGDTVTNRTVSVGRRSSTDVVLTWNTSVGQNGTYAATVASADSNASVPVAVQAPSDFRVNVTDSNAPVWLGDTLGVNATVTNVGDATDTQAISLNVSGAEHENRSLTLDGNETAAITLEWTPSNGTVGDSVATVSSADASDSTPVSVRDPESSYPSIVDVNAPVTAGDDLTVDARISTRNETGAVQNLSLVVAGIERDRVNVSLGAPNGMNATDRANGTDATIGANVTNRTSGVDRTNETIATNATLVWSTATGDAGRYNATVATADDEATVAVSVESAPDDSGGGGGGIALPGGGSDDAGDDESDDPDSDTGSENDSDGDESPGSFDLTVDDTTGPVVLQGEGASADATTSADVGASVDSVEVVAVEATAASSAESFQVELRAGDSSGPDVDGQVVDVLQVDGGGVLSDAMVTLSVSADAVPEGADDDQLTLYTLVDGEWVSQSEGAAGEDLAANVAGSGAVAVVADDGEGGTADSSAGDGSSVPGFGVVLAILAIATALVGRAHLRR